MDLSPLQTGTAVRAVHGGGSLQANMLLLHIAMSFILPKSFRGLYIENVIVDLSPLQMGTSTWAMHGGGSLQAMSFMSRKSDRLSGEHSSRGETSLFSASALDMRRHFPKLGPFPSIHAVVEPGEVVCVF